MNVTAMFIIVVIFDICILTLELMNLTDDDDK